MDVVFVTRLNGSASGCHYLQAICPQGDNEQFPVFSLELPFLDKLFAQSYVEVSNCGGPGGVFCFNAFNGRIVLCNPLANTLKFLPPTRITPPSSYIIFDNCGFGYDSTSNDYKVIRIFDVYYDMDDGRRCYSSCITKSELFSFRSNSWKEIQSPYLDMANLCTLSGYALVGCSYHWLVRASDNNFILAFNFSEEIFSLISLPLSYKRSTSLCRIVNTPNNLLGVILYSRVGDPKSFEIWEHGTDEDWSKLYDDATLNVEKPLNLNGSLMYVFRETARGFGQLLVYDWVEQSLKELDIYDYKNVLGIASITSCPTTPNLRKPLPINRFQSAEDWNVYWSKLCEESSEELG